MATTILLIVGTIFAVSTVHAVVATIVGAVSREVDTRIKSDGIFKVSLWQLAISGILLIGISIGMS